MLFCIDFGRNFTFSKSYIFISKEDEKVRGNERKERKKLYIYVFLVFLYVFRSVCVKECEKCNFMNFEGKKVFFGVE